MVAHETSLVGEEKLCFVLLCARFWVAHRFSDAVTDFSWWGFSR
jgi:hypothetical protein